MSSDPALPPGILVVVAGPSGAGKTTLARHLVTTFPNTCFSVSTTTRQPRGEEEDGLDYFFVSQDEFDRRLNGDYFLEWAEVHGHRYGTSVEWVRETLAGGMSVVLDIDVQGALQVKEIFPGSVLIFVLPPTPSVLMKRLVQRSTDGPDVIQRRLHAAVEEIGWIGSFDYFILNDGLSDSFRRAESIFSAESARLSNRSIPQSAMQYAPERFRGLEHWKGRKVVVSSGPTREFMDDVRFLSNRSSGRMGTGLAEAFRDAGAAVVLVTGPCPHSDAASVDILRVETADEMLQVLRESIQGADLLVMSAAVSDFRPVSRVRGKMDRKGPIDMELEPTPDILESLGDDLTREGCRVLAFALEYGDDAVARATGKMKSKGASMLFMNRGDLPGSGMETPGNGGVILFDDGSTLEVPQGSKRIVAGLIAAAAGRYLAVEPGGSV